MTETEQATQPSTSFLDKRVWSNVGLRWETLLYIAIIALAFALRFWDLGTRVLHHDESIHATFSWYLYSGRGYVHDPVYHGPFLYHANALVYFLLGVSDYTARVAPAFFGLLLVGLPIFLRRQLGRQGALVASLFLAIAPSVLYYSRSLRHDIFAAMATVLLVVCLWCYVSDRKDRWLYGSALALLLLFTNHELSYITVFIVGSFLIVLTIGEWIRFVAKRDASVLSPFAQFLGFLVILVAPFAAPIILVPLQYFGVPMMSDQAVVGMWITLAVLSIVCAAIGWKWKGGTWLKSALLLYVGAALLYTGFLTNPKGFQTGFLGSLQYWLTQHEYARGSQPVYYYLLLLPLYEFVPLIFALCGVVYAVARRKLFLVFLAYWFIVSFVIYSWAGEKMPWLVIHIAIPAIILAGAFLGGVIRKIGSRVLTDRTWWVAIGAAVVAFGVLLGLFGIEAPSQSSPMNVQRNLLQWIASGIILAACLYLLFRNLARLRAKLLGPFVVVAALAIMCPFWIRAAWQVNYYNGDVPVEMLVYTQSSPDVAKVMGEIDRVGFRLGEGKDIKVAYDSDVSWPFEWYLRDYRYRNFYGSDLPAADAPVVLVGFDENHDAKVKAALGNKYIGQRYKLRWWFPEDYKTPEEWIRALEGPDAEVLRQSGVTLGFGDVVRSTLKSDSLARLWNYFVNRQTLSPLGSTDFMMYVRKDLASGLWAATATVNAASPGATDVSSKLVKADPVATYGSKGTGKGQFNEPKNVAAMADGSIVVLDTKNGRVQRLSATGEVVASWGEPGSGSVQFSDPWGIAVGRDGSVYVADTWNHRVQKFDASGRLLLSWGSFANTSGKGGSPGQFFGPRAIAVDAQERVLVVDTGNHRVQVFDKNGSFISQFGQRGSASGQFEEPVGIAIGPDGSVYVADTWNRRIQKFDATFNYQSQWNVDGWEGDSVTNKPYLAVARDGTVFASDPDNGRVLRYSTSGAFLATYGVTLAGKDTLLLPSGVALDSADRLIVANSGSHNVIVYPVLSLAQ